MHSIQVVVVAALMIAPAMVVSQIPTNGLVARYPFTGNAQDSSGNGYNGTVTASVLTTDRNGIANSAYSFSGGAEIALPSVFKYPSFTLCTWIYTTATTGWDQTIFTMFQNSDNFLKLYQNYAEPRLDAYLKLNGSIKWGGDHIQ